jgi:hypothetical protein
MAITVFVNGRSVAHKASSGMSVVFPDVCKTPAPSMGTPLPYPNFATTATARQKQRQTGAIGLKTPTGSDSTGLPSASGQGVIPKTVGGQAQFVNYSFDVKYEGSPVVRHEVTQLHNSLDHAHAQLKRMTSVDPDVWQRLIQDYVVNVSALYMTLKDDE